MVSIILFEYIYILNFQQGAKAKKHVIDFPFKMFVSSAKLYNNAFIILNN